jgi:carboxylesterase type B
MISLKVVVFAFCLSIHLATGWEVGQEVRTSSGWIKGHASTWQPAVSEYLGIPFARPPVGSLRFTAPKAYHGDGKITADHFVSVTCLCFANSTK